jgi:hypothetical protein
LRLGLAGVYGKSIGVLGFFEVLYLSVESVFVKTFATRTTTTGCGIAKQLLLQQPSAAPYGAANKGGLRKNKKDTETEEEGLTLTYEETKLVKKRRTNVINTLDHPPPLFSTLSDT